MTTYGLVYNTKKLKEAEVPHNYEQLLDPKWKGRIAWRAGSETGDTRVLGTMLRAMGTKKGTKYIKKFAKQKIINLNISARTIVDRVGQGEYDMCFGCSAHQQVEGRSDRCGHVRPHAGQCRDGNVSQGRQQSPYRHVAD